MKKEYGFTLAELLAVVIILGIIISITIPVVTNQIDKYRKKLCITQYENILNAARAYGADNISSLSTSGENTVTLSNLKRSGYIENKEIQNPVDKSIIQDTLTIKITNKGTTKVKYDYSFDFDVETKCSDE